MTTSQGTDTSSYAEGAFMSYNNQSPYWHQPQKVKPARPWYRRTFVIVLFLVFFFPIGLVLLWMRPDWSVGRRLGVTAIVGVLVLIGALNQSPTPSTTTVVAPVAAGGTSTPAQAPSSSQPASPPPVVTTSSAPATSAAPKTTTAAPAPVRTSAAPVHTEAAVVHTSAAPAPVHTTEAPQPVQTTTQAQQSCHPLTNGGNCYKPGEYCRASDHGVSGIDAEGDPIKCEDNDGWRWERV